jgi:hypothetical protein
MESVLTFWDLVLTPLAILLVLFVSSAIRKKNLQHNPLYEFYTLGAAARIVGSISICLIYTYYYQGGDTINYYTTSKNLIGLFGKEKSVFFDVLFGNSSKENLSFFDDETGYPFFWDDKNALFVARFITPICMLAGKSFLATSVLIGWVCYTGMWRMYLLFVEQFPTLKRELAFAILFAPSVVFWGSGILKDTITISCVGWYSYGVYRYFIQKRYSKVKYLVAVFVASYLLIAIKPYILFALLPGSILWLSYSSFSKIRSRFFKLFAAPLLIVIAFSAGFFLLQQLGSALGTYSLDKVMNQAVIVQQDMKQDYYQGNTFDIGVVDASIGGLLSKAHLAIIATLFRPFLWDVKNPVMFLSALENTYILGLTIFLLIRLRIFGFFALIGKHPLLIFSLMFSLFFAFSVGISISNFGALVRLKIPCIPFFLSSMFILKFYYDKGRGKSMKELIRTS